MPTAAFHWLRNGDSMWCQKCKRLLAPDEPVWHYRRSFYPGSYSKGETGIVFNVCRKCCEREGWLDEERLWLKPQPCEQCGRPLHWNRRQLHVKYHVCSYECARRIWAKNRGPHYLPVMHEPRACAECGQSFYPKRTDARFCSPACKQRAYRKRSN